MSICNCASLALSDDQRVRELLVPGADADATAVGLQQQTGVLHVCPRRAGWSRSLPRTHFGVRIRSATVRVGSVAPLNHELLCGVAEGSVIVRPDGDLPRDLEKNTPGAWAIKRSDVSIAPLVSVQPPRLYSRQSCCSGNTVKRGTRVGSTSSAEIPAPATAGQAAPAMTPVTTLVGSILRVTFPALPPPVRSGSGGSSSDGTVAGSGAGKVWPLAKLTVPLALK